MNNAPDRRCGVITFNVSGTTKRCTTGTGCAWLTVRCRNSLAFTTLLRGSAFRSADADGRGAAERRRGAVGPAVSDVTVITSRPTAPFSPLRAAGDNVLTEVYSHYRDGRRAPPPETAWTPTGGTDQRHTVAQKCRQNPQAAPAHLAWCCALLRVDVRIAQRPQHRVQRRTDLAQGDGLLSLLFLCCQLIGETLQLNDTGARR